MVKELRIFKYPLEITDFQKFPIKGLYEILSVLVQHDELVLYASVVESSNLKPELEVIIKGTGHPFNDTDTTWIFAGTHLMKNDTLVWHVWHRLRLY